jgi:uncharacterized membrane protein
MPYSTVRPLVTSGLLLGIGMGGSLDGIVLHQLLQFHNMLSARYPPTSVVHLEVNMFWDGMFHLLTWVITLVGIAALGCPPDIVFPAGQNWGFVPLHPHTIRTDGYRYVRCYVQHHMEFAKVLRIDHMPSFHRVYWIPPGGDAKDGAFNFNRTHLQRMNMFQHVKDLQFDAKVSRPDPRLKPIRKLGSYLLRYAPPSVEVA